MYGLFRFVFHNYFKSYQLWKEGDKQVFYGSAKNDHYGYAKYCVSIVII